jgi:valyl-tRNA synthetase
VHPGDKRYKDMVGKEYEIPGVLGKFKIKVVADRVVDPNFGSGAVKVTPSHSIIDSEIAERHSIPFKQIIDKNGRMMEKCGKYAGMKTDEAREEIVKDMEKMGLIDHIDENYVHNIALCYRCGSVIENLPSLQWFLKMDKLAKMAIKAVEKKKVIFHPSRWSKAYLNWLKNVRDWNISRQIWWGHKIPISGVDDVLDTWFSSALWPFAVFNDKKDLKNFYPTNTLVTDRGIINLWVARMVFSGLEFMKKPPFKDVLIHATILTKEGKRMSKSLGTGLDPLDFIEKYGADATRFALIWQTMGTQDIHWSEESLLAGRKFLNKIWNASRFVFQQIGNSKFQIPNSKQILNSKSQKLTNADKEILQKLKENAKKTAKNIDKYEFGQALHELYEFFWHDFCDKYLEASKLQTSDINLKDNTQKILIYILSTSLKFLHPFIPHITEEIWSKIPLENKSALIIEKWPTI